MRLLTFLTILFLSLPLSAQETLGIGVLYLPKKLNLTKSDDIISTAILTNITSHFGEGKERTSAISQRRRETENGQEWIFEYKPNISLNETTAYTPQVIIDTLEYFRNNSEVPEYKGIADSLSNIRTPQHHKDFTPNNLNIWLKSPDANFPNILKTIPLINVPLANTFKQRIGEGTNMPTYGHFIIKDFRPNQQLTLERNRHFGLNDNPEGYELIQFKVFPELGERLRALRTGNILIILEPTLEEVNDAGTDSTLEIIESPILSTDKIILRKSLLIDNNFKSSFKLEGIKRGE
jgi:hypothetical protein